MNVFGDRDLDDPAADFGRDMDDIGIEGRIIRRRHDRALMLDVEPEDDRRRDDRERGELGPPGVTARACGLHGHCPNQSSHAVSAPQSPMAAQTNS